MAWNWSDYGTTVGYAGTAGLFGLAGSLASSYLGSAFGKKQVKFNAAVQNKLYRDQRAIDWDYFERENQYNYDLAQKYAQNSAKWQMQGLENAGLNPLLAVTSGGSMPQQIAVPSADTSGGSMPSVNGDFSSRDSRAPNLTSAVRDIASARLASATATTEEKRPAVIDADIQHTLQQAALARANAAKTIATTAAEIEKLKAETAYTQRKTEIADRPHTFVAETADWAFRRAQRAVESALDFLDTRKLFNGDLNDTSHSAKDSKTTIEVPHSGKTQSDYEKDRIKFYQDVYRRYKGISN